MASQYADRMEIEVFTQIDKLPHFNPDDTATPQASVVELRSKIEQADGVIICSPEYVFSLPGSLKNAIEWTVSTTVFSSKPVALIVAAASGHKAFESLELVMKTIEARILDDSKVLINGIKGRFNKEGELDNKVIDMLDKLSNSLMNCIEDENLTPSKYSENE